jgi:two-component system response regulator
MKKLSVLLLEDDPDDRFITESVLAELKYQPDITFVTHSDELFAALKNTKLPHLILVDFNSRPENGLTVLQKLRSNEAHKTIPVVILGDSSQATYVKDCYRHGASSVVKKPDSYEETKTKISDFFNYWMHVAEL